MKKIVFLTGAGMSQESGISTFRDHNGLWENHRIEEVASPEGFLKNPELVLEFYNKRRAQLKEVEPNAGHRLIASLENQYEVSVITQNVDDLHERAGSKNVLHLHGELRKVRPIDNLNDIIHWEDSLNLGDVNHRGVQLRPHIVWFGEDVPLIPKAAEQVSNADIVVVVGTSLQVYPAAGLIYTAAARAKKFYIDPNPGRVEHDVHVIKQKASDGIAELVEYLNEIQ